MDPCGSYGLRHHTFVFLGSLGGKLRGQKNASQFVIKFQSVYCDISSSRDEGENCIELKMTAISALT